VRCIPGAGAGAGAGGGADLVVLEKEKQPELNVAAARTSPRDRNFIMLVSPGQNRSRGNAKRRAASLLDWVGPGKFRQI